MNGDHSMLNIISTHNPSSIGGQHRLPATRAKYLRAKLCHYRLIILPWLFALASCQPSAETASDHSSSTSAMNVDAASNQLMDQPAKLGEAPSSARPNSVSFENKKNSSMMGSDPEFLPVDKAFVLDLIRGEQGIELVWTIAPHYYLYKHKFTIRSQNDEQSPLKALTDVAAFGQGLRKTDDYFGRVEVYYHQALASITQGQLLSKNASGQTIEPAYLNVQYQGCADAGLCYPVQTRTLQLND